MTKEEFKNTLIGIQPSLDCLSFLYDRIHRDDYRGKHALQHYRWNAEYIEIVLRNLPPQDYLYHTQGDIRHDYLYTPQEKEFCDYLKNVNQDLQQIGCSVSDMAIRKIVFVNLQRMGFVQRYTEDKKLCEPGKKDRYRYVRITDRGLEFVQAKNLFEKQRILGSALDSVFGGLVQDVLDLINELNKSYLSVIEIAFFVTYLGYEYKGNIVTKDLIISFIEEFRSLQTRQKSVEDCVAKYCNPCNFKGNKANKKDFHNWKNEAQTICNSLGLMAYFEYDKRWQKLLLKTEINGEKIHFKRSSMIKQEYFLKHNVIKDVRFELHHIVPFYFAKDICELKVIDSWENLIYINADNHNVLSRDKEMKQAIKLQFEGNDAVLHNFAGKSVKLEYNISVKYNVALQETMYEYNKKLLGY